jgi:hypothetical protein
MTLCSPVHHYITACNDKIRGNEDIYPSLKTSPQNWIKRTLYTISYHLDRCEHSMASKQEDKINDFSCYITVQNDSDSDLLLADFGVNGRYGVWPLYQPLNTIEAGSTARVHLQDPQGELHVRNV